MDHRRIDERSLAMHRAIAEKLRRSPELLAVAFDNLSRWEVNLPRSQRYRDEWRALLGRPIEEVLQVIVHDTEHMTALRQASPFAGVLTPKERWAIYERFESQPK